MNRAPASSIPGEGLLRAGVRERRVVAGRARLRARTIAGYAFISPWLFGFLALTLFPMAASLYFAFTDYDILTPPRWIGLANFRRMFFEDPRYLQSVAVTFFYVAIAVPLRLAFALAVAMLLNTPRRGVSVYRAAYYAPSVVDGSVAVAVMWRQVFGTEGVINAVLAILGIPPVRWLGDPEVAIWTLITLAVWQFGSPMLIFLAGLRQIPAELYEAAAIDGAGAGARFFRITLPMLSPVTFFSVVMQTITGFMVFTQAFIVTGGGPMDTTLLYALYLYRRAFESFQMGYASAMAWALLLVVAFFTALLFKSSGYWVFYEAKERR
ncbi:MAG TPA: sugar ABC transporter permease [Methylomirabilota bacterium]|nr:sugar ABC transporter permease [Methylomirabilota bacterium]